VEELETKDLEGTLKEMRQSDVNITLIEIDPDFISDLLASICWRW
jgi:hypothetical protein